MARLATSADDTTCFAIWQQQLAALRLVVPGDVRDSSLEEWRRIIAGWPRTAILISDSNKAFFSLKRGSVPDYFAERSPLVFARLEEGTRLQEAIFRTDMAAAEFRNTAKELFDFWVPREAGGRLLWFLVPRSLPARVLDYLDNRTSFLKRTWTPPKDIGGVNPGYDGLTAYTLYVWRKP